MKYTIKVWLFTVLIAPILLLILWCITSSSQISDAIKAWPILFFMIPYGLVLSAPAMFFFGLIQWEISSQATSNKTKTILSLYSFISVWITFYLFDDEFVKGNFQQLSWVISYTLTIVVGVWVFKLKKDDNNKINNQNQG